MIVLSVWHSVTEETDYRMRPGLASHWQNAVIEGQELDDQVKRARQRCDAKDALVADVIAGRQTLFQAAVQFRTLDASNPHAAHWLGYQYPDQPYEVALCHSIIHRVKLELHARASEQEDDIVSRLKAELAEHLRHYGRVCLTD
jgi:hypothetical protein